MHYLELLHEVNNAPEIIIKGTPVKEIINAQLRINTYNFMWSEVARPRELVYKYLIGELAWYYSGERSTNNIIKYSKYWDKLKNPDGTVNSNYGYRIFYNDNKYGYTPFIWALHSLKKDKNTRQAIMVYSDKDMMRNDNLDFLCTQSHQFLIRDNHLISIICLRSSDVIMGLSFDIPWYSIVHQQMKVCLLQQYPGLICGPIYVNIGSAHLYANKYEVAAGILSNSQCLEYIIADKFIPLYESFEWYEKNIEQFLWISK